MRGRTLGSEVERARHRRNRLPLGPRPAQPTGTPGASQLAARYAGAGRGARPRIADNQPLPQSSCSTDCSTAAPSGELRSHARSSRLAIVTVSRSPRCARNSASRCDAPDAAVAPAYLINGPDEIDPDWLVGCQRAGVTSGASTPEVLVEAVIVALDPAKVTLLEDAEEDITFTLPRELR